MGSQRPPAGYRTQSEDTTYSVEQILFERWRRMEASEKLDLVRRLVRATHELSLIGLRERWPDASEAELRLRVAAPHLGRALTRSVFGFDPDARGP